jgi:mannose-6-phosphate isomerase-like protein (cupin superfamily)
VDDRPVAGRPFRHRRPGGGQCGHRTARRRQHLPIVEFPPVTPQIERLAPDNMHGELAAHAPKRGQPPRHPLMHRTRTVDYAVVMEGEIDMLLDDSEIHLAAGDVLIQQGTNHAWVNRGTQTCRIAFVLIDAMEP